MIMGMEGARECLNLQTSLEGDKHGLTYRLKNELQTVEDLYLPRKID